MTRAHACVTVILLLGALALSAAPSRAQVPAYDEGIVELSIDRLSPLTLIVYIDSAGNVLLPVAEVAAHLGLAPVRAGAVIQLPRIGGGTIRFDTQARMLRLPNGDAAVAPAELVVTDTDVYLRLERLALLFEAESFYDAQRLAVTFTRTTPFPAQQRVIAEQRRALMLALQRREALDPLDSVRYTAATGAGVVDWDVSTSSLDPTRRSTLRTQFGAALLGGDLTMSAAFEAGRDAGDAVRDVALRYHRFLPHGTVVRQVSAGDVLTSGLLARQVRGIEVSNRPLQRSYELGAVLVRPDLPPGWEYEVFQGGQLLGWSDPAGNDAVSIPLRTGSTPVQVRMLGPAGEEVVSTLLYQTPVSLLRRHALEYVAGTGTCAAQTCERYAHADVRYGATSLITFGGGIEMIEDSTTTHARPYMLSTFSTGTLLTGELTLMPGAQYGSSIGVYPRENSAAHVRLNVARSGFGPVTLLPSSRSRWDAEFTWDERLPARVHGVSGVRGGAAAFGTAGRMHSWRVTAAAQMHSGNVELRYDRLLDQARPGLLTVRGAMLTPVSVRGRTYRPLVNAGLGTGSVGVRFGELGVSLQPGAASVVSAALQWTRSRAPTLTLGYSARIGTVHTRVRVAAGDGRGSSALSVGGSTLLTHDRSIVWQQGPRSGYAGMEGVVFADRDGDGVFSDGDDVVPDARITVGTQPVTADEEGRWRIFGLQPYNVHTIGVDSARMADPSWTTAAPLHVRPVPNITRRIDVPLIRTRELAGSIIADAEGPTVASLSLVITNRDTGEQQSALTFSDGQFYVSRIRPGRYRLEVAQASLDAIGAVSEPAFLDFDVTVSDDPFLEVPPLRLAPRGAGGGGGGVLRSLGSDTSSRGSAGGFRSGLRSIFAGG